MPVDYPDHASAQSTIHHRRTIAFLYGFALAFAVLFALGMVLDFGAILSGNL